MNDTNWPLLLTVMTLVLGGFGVFCITRLVRMIRLQRSGRRVMGSVVAVTRSTSGSPKERDVTWSTTVSYEVAGKRFQFDLPLSNSPDYSEGETLPVYFAADRPEQGVVICRREYFQWIVLIVVCFGVLGGLFYVALS